MLAVKVIISRYTDDAQPGWVECRLTDASGKEWLFNEKVPIVTEAGIDENTVFPESGSIACKIKARWRDSTGREGCTIDTSEPWGVESVDGMTVFDVWAGQIIEIGV